MNGLVGGVIAYSKKKIQTLFFMNFMKIILSNFISISLESDLVG